MLENALLIVLNFILFLTIPQLFLLIGFEDRGTSASRPFNATTPPLSSISYEDDFVSSPGSVTLTEKKSTLESQ